MNYERIHNEIITRAETRPFKRQRGLNGRDFELHHIIPRCMGGRDEENNLVLLTTKEHFVVHHLLCKIHPKVWGLFRAISKMMHSKQNGKVTATLYQWLKANKPPQPPITEEARAKIKIARARQIIIHSKETRIRMSKAAKNQKRMVCEWCSKETNMSNHTRFHGDMCKYIRIATG